jgi:hypothetical protein
MLFSRQAKLWPLERVLDQGNTRPTFDKRSGWKYYAAFGPNRSRVNPWCSVFDRIKNMNFRQARLDPPPSLWHFYQINLIFPLLEPTILKIPLKE